MTNQEILDNAPEGATHVSDNGVYYRYDSDFIPALYWARGEEWIENNKITHLCRSLADIKRIAELEQLACMDTLSKSLAIRDLEQQLKTAESFLNMSQVIGKFGRGVISEADAIRKRNKIFKELQALKEQSK